MNLNNYLGPLVKHENESNDELNLLMMTPTITNDTPNVVSMEEV